MRFSTLSGWLEELGKIYRSGEPINDLDKKKVDQFVRKFS
jgi:hypothetical protein